MNNPIISTLKQGDEVSVIINHKQGKWYEVFFGGGKAGWMHSSLLSKRSAKAIKERRLAMADKERRATARKKRLAAERKEKRREEKRIKKEKEVRLKICRERANSDDAQSVTEAWFHGEARALVILHVEPNKLQVGGEEFRVKRNPVGKGCFVYDPRTRFYGVKRNLVWWVPKEGKAYPLNSPSKMVTPSLKWPREEGIDAPSASAVIGYVFEAKPMSASSPIPSPSSSKTDSFTVKEYKIYRAVIDTPMTRAVSEAQAIQNIAKRYGVTVAEVQKVTKKVQNILFRNKWFASPEAEIRHSSDWNDDKP